MKPITLITTGLLGLAGLNGLSQATEIQLTMSVDTSYYSGGTAGLTVLSAEIQDAHAGVNASNGWADHTAGAANNEAINKPWGRRAGIDGEARWEWYSRPGSLAPTQGGFNHDEWLVLRIALAATPDNPVPDTDAAANATVPEPSSLLLALLGLIGIALRRRPRPPPPTSTPTRYLANPWPHWRPED